MFGFARGLRHGFRLVEIVLILARHDALFPLEQMAGAAFVARALRRLRRRDPARLKLRPGQRLAEALQALGPSFIKLGQALSLRADLIGEEVATDLALLQDRLPPFPGAEARATVERELGQSIASLYRSFDAEAIAAASIAQVHLAVTTEGEEVAVKVLRPGIGAAFARDIALFLWLATLAERLEPRLRRLKPREVVLTLAQSVRLEMDLRFEAAGASELRENFTDDPGFHVPRVDWRRTARQVVTLERVSGIRVDDRGALVAAGHDVREILKKAAAHSSTRCSATGSSTPISIPAISSSMRTARSSPSISASWAGSTARRATTSPTCCSAFLTGDYDRVAEVHFEAGYIPPHQSRDWFAQACRAIGEPILGRPLHEISLGRLLAQLFQVTEEFEMETQPQLLLLQKTMVRRRGCRASDRPRPSICGRSRGRSIEDWMRENRGPEAQGARRRPRRARGAGAGAGAAQEPRQGLASRRRGRGAAAPSRLARHHRAARRHRAAGPAALDHRHRACRHRRDLAAVIHGMKPREGSALYEEWQRTAPAVLHSLRAVV